mgnify:CR=1 FL=1
MNDRQMYEMDKRVRRIETRLCRLMLALGVEPTRGDNETPGDMQPDRVAPRDYAPEPSDRWSTMKRKLMEQFTADNEKIVR